MSDWIASALRRPALLFALGGTAVALTALTMLLERAPAFAQGRPPAVAQAPAQPAPKAQPKAAPQPKGAAQPAPAQPQAAGSEVPQLMYSPWTKICVKGQEANAQQVCFTGKEGRLPDNGMMVLGAVLIEPEGSPTKMLRLTLPLGMLLAPGTRVIVDQGQPMTAPYATCLPAGCVVELEASAELIGKFKKGQSMVVQAVSGQGGAISLPMPLPDFAKAYDGPPTDPKVVEERNKKLQEEFTKKQQQQQQAQ